MGLQFMASRYFVWGVPGAFIHDSKKIKGSAIKKAAKGIASAAC